MWSVIQRAIVPLVLLAAGIGAAIYGARHHMVAVAEEHEEEMSIPIPTPFAPGPPGPEGEPFPGGPPMPGGPPDAEGRGPGGPPMDMPPEPWRPPQLFTKVIKKVIVTIDEPEPKVIREVSVGGLTLTASGEIQRTYSGDEGPALCPT
jgi:hypothetical protein